MYNMFVIYLDKWSMFDNKFVFTNFQEGKCFITSKNWLLENECMCVSVCMYIYSFIFIYMYMCIYLFISQKTLWENTHTLFNTLAISKCTIHWHLNTFSMLCLHHHYLFHLPNKQCTHQIVTPILPSPQALVTSILLCLYSRYPHITAIIKYLSLVNRF